ncbi:MAG: SPFH domain-containing protein [Thermodesulfobacteriota bacterium]
MAGKISGLIGRGQGEEEVQTPAKGFSARLRFMGRRSLVLTVLVAMVGLMILSSMMVYVRPNEYGIKVVKIGARRGVQEKVYTAGLHFVMPFGIHQMHRLPRDIRVLEMSNTPQTAAKSARVEKAAHIQTSDGFFVSVDVSILYHIQDPLKVFTLIGPGRLYEDNGIIPKTEPVLKETLGELTTEEFYNSKLRVEKMLAARTKLNEELNPKGVKVDHVLIRYFHYSDEIQKNIEEKKLKDQMVFKNQAEARAASEYADLEKTIKEGEMHVAVKLTEGKAYITKRRAEKDLYVRSMRAKADLLIQLAEARKTKLRNDAYQVKGSDRLVGLKMAEALKGLELIVLSSDGPNGVNPLDLDRTIQLFGVSLGGAK